MAFVCLIFCVCVAIWMMSRPMHDDNAAAQDRDSYQRGDSDEVNPTCPRTRRP